MRWRPSQVYRAAESGLNIVTRGLLPVLTAGLSAIPATILGQGARPAEHYSWLAPLVPLGGPFEDRARVGQILDSTQSTAGFLLRSPSSMTPRLVGQGRMSRVAILAPSVETMHNSALPYSGNDGSLWAGRGVNVRAIAGVRAEWGALRLVLAPELVYTANRDYNAFALAPRAPAGLSLYANPWYTGLTSIDLPLRFGDRPLQRVEPGQSSLAFVVGAGEFGVATENEWWGPGVRNALILSNNAPGFPHLFLRTRPPIETGVGAFEGRWLVGGLSESSFFDASAENDLRSISMLALTWQPRWVRNVTVGAARAVFARTSGWGDAAGSFAQVFSNVGRTDPPQDGERDQLFSLFFRLVFPQDGFETYAEWARAEQPVSLRDLLLSPNHSQAYTLGFQWAGAEVAPWGRARGRVRVRGEVSFLEQSTTFRFRPLGTWYTSPRVVQGYTNRGQSLGAAIGPGSSGQFLGVDYLTTTWQVGVFAERTRWLEDAHSYIEPQTRFCNHDVSFLPGVAGAIKTRLGTVSASYSSGWRLNTYFLFKPGNRCFDWDGVDVRNHSLSVSFSPIAW